MIILIIYLQFFPYKYFSRLSQIGIFVSIILLFITLLFGVSRECRDGLWDFNHLIFKTCLISYIKNVNYKNVDEIKDFKKGLLPILWPVLVICGLILPADFSIAAMLLIVCFTMIFIGGAKIKHLVSIVGTASYYFDFIKYAFQDYYHVLIHGKRMMSYGSGDKQENYQAEMAKRAVANGFLFEKGPGRGHVKISESLPIRLHLCFLY